MKKIQLLLLLFVCSMASMAQQTSVGVAGTPEAFNDVCYDPAGGSVAAGIQNGDIYIVRMNAAGVPIWQRTFNNPGGPDPDQIYRIKVAANGDYLACGRMMVTNGQRARGFVCRINSNTGAIIWSCTTQPMGSAFGEVFYDLVELPNGNIALAGTFNFTPSACDGIIVMLNNNGVQQWVRRSDWNSSDEFITLCLLPGGNLCVIGHYWTGNFYNDIVLQVTPAGVVASQDYYTEPAFAVPINPGLNSMWPSRCFISGGNVILNSSVTTGSGNAASVQGIYTYNPVARTINGRYYYHSPQATAFAFYPVGANDFILAQSNNAAAVYVTRITNNVLTYDRQINNATTNGIYNIDVATGGNMVLSGVTGNNNDGYLFYSNIGFPVSNAPCGIANVNNLQQGALNPGAANPVINYNNTNATALANYVSAQIINPQNQLCIPPCPQNATTNVNKCSNQAIVLTARNGVTYNWNPVGGLSAPNIQNPVCTANTNTTYTCTITDANGCVFQDVFVVTVNAAPQAFTRDTTICVGDSVQLVAANGTAWNWLPNTDISNTTIQNPIVWPPVTTVYTVTVSNAAGCSAVDSFRVTVGDCHCEDSCNWSLTGNSNVKARNFIGSINPADFKIRTANLQRMVVSAAGDVGINTFTPTKLLDVNGEARVAVLPPSVPNDRLVMADNSGNLRSLLASGIPTQYLAGNGTWQNLPGGSGTVTAAQGLTVDAAGNVVLGADCGTGLSPFATNREVNMNNSNLYFNSDRNGKVYIGPGDGTDVCRELFARLELNSAGLRTYNDYTSPLSSPSGLRFNSMNMYEKPIPNKSEGVLSLDQDGDVIWVEKCCNGKLEDDLKDVLKRLTAVEKQLDDMKARNSQLEKQLVQTNVVLEGNASIVLNQNVPNPFGESTTISYSIPKAFHSAKLVFTAENGEIIKTAEIKAAGKGTVNVYAAGITAGLYAYTLVIDGKTIASKKMVKQ